MRIGSLFTGYGGLDLAVETVLDDPELVFVADDDDAVETVLRARYPDTPNLGDVTRLAWRDVPTVDVLTGGTPCQDLSNAGKRLGMRHGTRSNLWVAMREAIAVLRPRLVVWENVRGATSAHAESDLELCPRCMGSAWADQPRLRALGRVLGDLADIGYDAAWTLNRASDVGAPHLRARIFLLAWPEDDPPTWVRTDLLERRRDPVRPVDRHKDGQPLLGTPAASIYRGSGPVGSPSHTARLERSYLDAQVVDMFPTPSVADSLGGHLSRGGDRADELLLGGVARTLGEDDDVELLPTPVVNDMGEGKTVEWWDEWAPRQQAANGTRAVHGRSLAIEAARLLPTPTARDWSASGGQVPSDVTLTDAVVRTDMGTRPNPRLLPTPTGVEGEGGPAGHRGGGPNLRTEIHRFGRYAAAVARWEATLGRPAPRPTEVSPLGSVRLAAPFVEWLMGLPAGWVTDLELGRRHELRILGNGVVPQQGIAALSELLAIVALSERS